MDSAFDRVLEEDDEEESYQSQDEDDDLENDDVLADEEYLTAVPVFQSSSAPSLAIKETPSSDPPQDANRQRISTALIINREESRRLFQRLWTDEDEIELLQGFLDYTSQRGSGHHDTALFYDQIKSKLQVDFNKNQLVEKLRRLKKKYRNVVSKLSTGKEFAFKSSHDQVTFEISRKIWSGVGKIVVEDGGFDDDDANGNPNLNDVEGKFDDHKSPHRSRKRSRNEKRVGCEAFVGNSHANNAPNRNVNVVSLIEETVKSCLSPLLKELVGHSVGKGVVGIAGNALPLSFGGGEMAMDDKWRKQQILELEVYSKRLELVQEQIRTQLEELHSMGR